MNFKRIITLIGINAIFFSGLHAQVNLLTQGFETLPFPPTGWSNVRLTGPSLPGNWARYGNGISPAQTPHSGSWQLRYNSANYGAGTSADLRTAVLNFTTAGTYAVSFWMYRDNWVANDKLQVYVNTAQTSVGGTLLGTINRDRAQSPTEGSNGWYQYSFSIPPTFNTATNYIIFKATSAFGKDIYVDDISVDRFEPSAPGCVTSFAPANGAAGLCTNATLAWDIVPLASGYKITAGNNAPDYNNVAENIDLGVALNYTTFFDEFTTYGWKITPFNGYGEATGCPINTFTTDNTVCYCIPIYLDGSCGSEDFIDDFSTTGGVTNITNNNTGCTTNPNNYTHFAAQNITIEQGLSFNVSMQSGPEFAEGFAVWIDFNIDGDFDDAGEFVFNSGISTLEIVNGTVTVPYTAIPGNTRMRVRCAYNYVPTAGTACATFNEGETQDYNVTITACATTTYYTDADFDTFGNIDLPVAFCYVPPAGFTLNNTDCNDANNAINPSTTEICNLFDDNCNALIDEGFAENIYYVDADADLFGSSLSTVNACTSPPGFVANNLDCNDAIAAINPSAPEICNGLDENCNGLNDEGLTFITYYGDADADTYGNAIVTTSTCNGAPIGYVANNIDCNDANTNINPGATEICNSIDDDCDASIDEGVIIATITPAGPTTFCSGGTVMLQATTGVGNTYQWIRNGGNIAGATGATYTTNKSGNYQVKVTVPGGCNATSTAIAVNVIAAPKATINAPGGTDLCGLPSVLLKTALAAGNTYQWIKNGSNIAGATSNTYNATTIGNYKVKVTNATGCNKTSATTMVTASCKTSIESDAISMTIYPNPATALVSLTLQNQNLTNNAAIAIAVFDLNGKQIDAQTINFNYGEANATFNVTDWAAGLYLVRATGPGIMLTGRIAVTK